MSNLEPHQERVVTERQDVLTKMQLLSDFIDSDFFKTLQDEDRDLLRIQFVFMTNYEMVLDQRIKRFYLA